MLKLTTSSQNIARFATATISGNQQQEWEMFEPTDPVLGCKPTSKTNSGRRLDGYPALFN